MRIPSSKGFSAASASSLRETPPSASSGEFRLPTEVEGKVSVEVRLSDRAATHATFVQTLKTVSEPADARQDRIAKLREKVARGEYQVSSADIADAILMRSV